MFQDREEAGERLGERLATLPLNRPVVYALPRGGVSVAAKVAQALHAPLDLVIVRKIGAPRQPELAVGAVVDGGEVVLNLDVVGMLGVEQGYLDRARERELAEIERRRAAYLGGRKSADPRGRDAIVVDDGLATGATALAALRGLRQRGAARVILAVPVAPREAVERLETEADEVVCLEEPEYFGSIGEFYADFHQLEDDEVIRQLDAAAHRAEV